MMNIAKLTISPVLKLHRLERTNEIMTKELIHGRHKAKYPSCTNSHVFNTYPSQSISTLTGIGVLSPETKRWLIEVGIINI